MKLNFDFPIKNFDNIEMKLEEGGAVYTAKLAVVNSLLAPEERIEGSEKLKRFALAKKVHAGGDLDLTVEQVALIKALTGKFASTLIAGQILNYIETPQGDNDAS